MRPLEDLDADLNEKTFNLLGDSIVYRRANGAVLRFRAFVDYGDNAEMMSDTRVVSGECAVEVPCARVETVDKADIVELPRRAGQRFNPKQVLRDESGLNWLIGLKRMPA